MCTLLIVEDEATFRDGIVSMIDWGAYGVQIVGAVANGQEAWTLIESAAPDLLLTDIRMPVMDGLELLQRVKQAGLPTQVILLSGFGEFEYAKQAMKLGAFDYLLKPCRPEEILGVVTAAIRSQQDHRHSRRLALEQLLCRWLQSPIDGDAAPVLAEHGMAIADGPVQVGLLRWQPGAGAPEATVRSRVSAALGPVYGSQLETFPFGEEWVWVGNLSTDAADAGALRSALERLRIELQGSVCIGVGGVRPGLAQLHESFAEARRALALREDRPQQHIFLFAEVTAAARAPAEGALIDPELTMREAEILQQMQAGRYAEAIDATQLWLEHLRRHPDYSRKQVQLRAAALLFGMQRTTQVQSIPAIRWKEELVEGINQLPAMETIDELSTIMTKYLQHLVAILSNHRPPHRTVQAAVKLVAAHYQTNLTLEAVAREVFVSTAYLSTLFKQELGINFLDYLHQYRVERAKELLVREQLKVFVVAKLVGYQDERHFSATFKKWTGISPSQYQKAVGQ